ncbi:uncharacterized protein BJ212DRAFT_793584 [Suillus subaureus]|uniref:Uncharacterized protein n=1 Tax=Suillus subaureus TaxID=48587 RepID=A0A9P7DXZ5_9AGAM|nr:uncharacterized protein BJ212DRAFT_793584 [Suillus subaureus]KAG1806136.1 hypothetical protein BJ212DRAFT_793584 [Suillus subaureus]
MYSSSEYRWRPVCQARSEYTKHGRTGVTRYFEQYFDGPIRVNEMVTSCMPLYKHDGTRIEYLVRPERWTMSSTVYIWVGSAAFDVALRSRRFITCDLKLCTSDLYDMLSESSQLCCKKSSYPTSCVRLVKVVHNIKRHSGRIVP